MCPVTLQEMNGSHAFVVLMTTGWVMSEKATKEVGIAGLQVCAYLVCFSRRAMPEMTVIPVYHPSFAL